MNAKLQNLDVLAADAHELAMQGFFGIMARWDANNKMMRAVLGSPAERTFFEWKKGKVARLPNDTLRRIGYVAGIWKALQIVYSDPQLADSWVNRPNRAFGGQTPLARMAAGDVTDLAAVRNYIDVARSPWS
ncbi:MAG TPA: MbcA/ParS/Xre antitoxin family protein [Pseudolabrys sp.]|nr:MbcA/ParS/Xre antitoxin family protein [Pseudolabrys sp.]